MRINRDRGLRVKHKNDDFSPMEGVGNMADAMLVFACGLILALIISWNVDISEQGEIHQTGNRYQVESIDENATDTTIESKDNLEEMGKVYRDPETGKYYVVEE